MKLDVNFDDGSKDLSLTMLQNDETKEIAFDSTVVMEGGGKINDVIIVDDEGEHSVVVNKVATIDLTEYAKDSDLETEISERKEADLVLSEAISGAIKLVKTEAYTGSQFHENDLIEYKGRSYICLKNVSGLDENKPDSEGGHVYWKPMNATTIMGSDPGFNHVDGDIWYDTEE